MRDAKRSSLKAAHVMLATLAGCWMAVVILSAAAILLAAGALPGSRWEAILLGVLSGVVAVVGVWLMSRVRDRLWHAETAMMRLGNMGRLYAQRYHREECPMPGSHPDWELCGNGPCEYHRVVLEEAP